MKSITPLVSALGVAQLISWGTLFYAIGVLGPPMSRDVGVSEFFLYGAFTAGLFVSGTLAPYVGRLVDYRGGRFALSVGSLSACLAFIVLGAASNPAMLVIGWLLAGVAMATCLYDPAFATLSQHTGAGFRKAVTITTIFGGLASTAFWPLSHLLLEAWGWRTTFWIYAGLHLVICLPLHLAFVPRRLGIVRSSAESKAQPEPVSPAFGSARLRWLTASFALASFTFAVIAVHVVSLLAGSGMTQAQAVSIAMLMGPLQVAGRVLELAFAGRVRSVSVGLAAYALMVFALLALLNVDGVGIIAILFVAAYGCGNGVFTVVKGTVPAELFGRAGFGGLLGYLSRAGLYARALAPASFSAMLAIGYSRTAALGILVALALAGLACYLMAIRSPERPQEQPPGKAAKDA